MWYKPELIEYFCLDNMVLVKSIVQKERLLLLGDGLNSFVFNGFWILELDVGDEATWLHLVNVEHKNTITTGGLCPDV